MLILQLKGTIKHHYGLSHRGKVQRQKVPFEKDAIEVDFEAAEVTDISFVDYVGEKLNFVPDENGEHTKNVRLMASFVAEMTEEEAEEILLKFIPSTKMITICGWSKGISEVACERRERST